MLSVKGKTSEVAFYLLKRWNPENEPKFIPAKRASAWAG